MNDDHYSPTDFLILEPASWDPVMREYHTHAGVIWDANKECMMAHYPEHAWVTWDALPLQQQVAWLVYINRIMPALGMAQDVINRHARRTQS